MLETVQRHPEDHSTLSVQRNCCQFCPAISIT